MRCPDCREREIEMPRVGLCRRCHLRRWTAQHPGYMAEAKRRYLANPENAERNRLASVRWKDEHREQNRRRDNERLDSLATGRCACGCRIFDGEDKCGRCKMTDRRQARREHIADMWNDGETMRQIATALNSTAKSVGVEMAAMRKEGWDLPHRRRAR